MQTLEIAFEGKDIPVSVHPDFYELGGMWNLHDVFPGMGKTEIFEKFPKFNVEKVPENGYFFLESMETHEQAWERAKKILEEIQKIEAESVGIMIHGLILNYILSHISGDPYEHGKR